MVEVNHTIFQLLSFFFSVKFLTQAEGCDVGFVRPERYIQDQTYRFKDRMC